MTIDKYAPKRAGLCQPGPSHAMLTLPKPRFDTTRLAGVIKPLFADAAGVGLGSHAVDVVFDGPDGAAAPAPSDNDH